eukprot:m.26176 g.26176  ORF g.26176 m.26176 type:complete len:53 (+) comp11668_c0_seq4:47-205(+)
MTTCLKPSRRVTGLILTPTGCKLSKHGVEFNQYITQFHFTGGGSEAELLRQP